MLNSEQEVLATKQALYFLYAVKTLETYRTAKYVTCREETAHTAPDMQLWWKNRPIACCRLLWIQSLHHYNHHRTRPSGWNNPVDKDIGTLYSTDLKKTKFCIQVQFVKINALIIINY